MNRKLTLAVVSLMSVGGMLAGCGQPETTAPPATGSSAAVVTPEPYKFKTRTGTPVTVGDPKLIAEKVASRTVSTRPDPFALLPVERGFQQSQTAERLVQDMGYSEMFEPTVEAATQEEVIEPQPYRRLAGVLVSDSVSAILIMEDGTAHLIKPGMRIPNSPWRVVSIDEEKAVLRRAGNVKPTQIVVRLETPPGGVPATGGGVGGPPAGGGRPGGGRPGGTGPGAPGPRGGGGRMGGGDIG